MPIWPFKKRRRNGEKDRIGAPQPLTEKAHPEQQQPPARASTYPPPGPTSPIAIPRKPSNRGSQRKRRASPEEEFTAAQSDGREKGTQSPQKENLAPPSSLRRGSREDITALPMSRRLDTSPHLRPVDMERPHIPYNFRPYSDSKTSIQREPAVSTPPHPNTLKKQRSTYSNGTPSRRQSSRRKRKDDHLREEEIRAMSAQMPIPKRPGDGPLRQDSKKMRGFGLRDSNVSLPPSDSVQSGMASIVEQRGWEIGSMDMFNPRPAVRLSNVPQYVTSNMPEESPLLPESPKKQKEKITTSREESRRRETIGNRADDFDASDLRMLLERDAKRREKRKKEQQEKLDRKLRDRGGRNRGDSDKKRREAKEQKREEEANKRAEEENRARELMTPPTDVHPALRDRPMEETAAVVGLGIGESQVQDQTASGAEPPKAVDEEMQTEDEQPQNPFTDDAASQPERFETPPPEPSAFSPVQTPMEDPVLETAQAIRLSQTNTPPLSPVNNARATSSLSQMIDERRASDMPLAPPPPIRDPDTRRSSDPKPEPRAGAWATFFRRGGTNLRRPNDGKATPSEKSFSNTSRESMRNQSLPAHLVDPQAGQIRRKSGTPVRTQSKFREDLPEMPISPPDSRMPSPDVTTAAAAAAAAVAARRGIVPQGSGTTDPDLQGPGRNDTPMSPSMRSHRMMSASMASVDSEASWLASGSKRHSTQSGLRGSVGSLSRQRPEFSGSFEELGGDKDAEYMQRMSPTPDARRALKGRTSALAGASPDEASEYDESPEPGTTTDPLTVHGSVRRQPTLVKGNPRMKSREGLLTGYSADPDSPEPLSATTGRSSMDFDTDEPESHMQRATSVDYGRGHARQVSSGSAKLLDLPPKRQSTGPPPMPEQSSSKL